MSSVQPNPLPIVDSCPPANEIATFLDGHASVGLSQQILEHVDNCQPCRLLLAGTMRTPGAAQPPPDARGSLQTFAVGEFVDSRYRIRRFISRGGMGEVYDAWDTQLHEAVALKTIACTGLDNNRLFHQLRAEVQLARRVTHRNVCRILEFGLHSRESRRMREIVPFFTMELLEGETLRQLILRRGTLEEGETIALILQVIDGLAAVHSAGIVHRDLKPDNVFILRPHTDATRVVVMDFGLARSLTKSNSAWSSNNASPVGTPAYMAPEQATGEAATTAWDIYAIGVILFELSTGTLPFKGNSPVGLALARLQARAPPLSSINPRSSAAFERIVTRCLERDPARRFVNLEELRSTLFAALHHRDAPWRRPALIAALIAMSTIVSCALVVWAKRAPAGQVTSAPVPSTTDGPRVLTPPVAANNQVTFATKVHHGEAAHMLTASVTADSILQDAREANGVHSAKDKGRPNSPTGTSTRPNGTIARRRPIMQATHESTRSVSSVEAKAGPAQSHLDQPNDDELAIPSFIRTKAQPNDRTAQ